MTQQVFNASGTFTPPAGVTSVDVLIVGGGGGGGGSFSGYSGAGGGGGAGGCQWLTGVAVTPGVGVTVTVGAAGAAGTGAAAGTSGGNSSFAAPGGTLTSLGGGMGYTANSGQTWTVTGGSGGGGAGMGVGSGALPASPGTAGQGNAGGAGNGSGTASSRRGGGGGGAGAAGTGSPSTPAGGVGVDMSANVGTGVGAAGWFAGGGGGGQNNTVAAAAGGTGGGGAGAGTPAPTAGATNTGGGGGGGKASGGSGAAGGSGIVVVVYSPPAAPNVPTSVAAGTLTGTTADLSWSAPSGGGPVTSYEVRLNGGAASAATSPHTFTGLTPATGYNLEVRAVGPGGNSGWVLVAVTTVALPNVPTAVAAGTIGYTTADLSWSAPSGGGPVTSYEVRLDGGAPSTATSPHTFTGLSPSTGYDLEVRAVGGGGVSSWVLVAVTTLVLPEGWYRVELAVGPLSYEVEYGETPELGVRLPLTLGWQLTGDGYPAQADPARMTFGLLADEATDLREVMKGSTVTFAMYLDPAPGADPWQFFSGVVTQVDGVITDAGRFRVTVYAGDNSMRLADIVIGYTTGWAQESIEDRLARIATEAGISIGFITTPDNAVLAELPARPVGAITALAALRDTLKDLASFNDSEPPDIWYGRWVYHVQDTGDVTLYDFERRVYPSTTLTLDGANVSAYGDWSKLPSSAAASWVLVDDGVFGTPAGPPLVRRTGLVDAVGGYGDAIDNLGKSLLPDGSTQLDGWWSDRITYLSFVDPDPMGPYTLGGEGLPSMYPPRFVVPVVITPLDPDYELNGTDYLAGTLTGAQLVIPAGGKHRVNLTLRPELLPGTDLP